MVQALLEAKVVAEVREAGDILQLMGNLIGNSILLHAPRRDDSPLGLAHRARVLIVVTDSGPGIDPADLPRLFERYWKGPDATRQGARLGLFIARGIVEAHGGTITIESRLADHRRRRRRLTSSLSRRCSSALATATVRSLVSTGLVRKS